ncbi:hypothetical protein G4Z16_19175 [Streptomyces bathyalis]|uniref:Uncharacterized protein n=1 Tax=Streptomyces bathyalis TaxID=2710756 RepID=A0A7T1WT32_9ACTN|nr:hypothetical protein [Streptomyces bathyalis]QPP08169.1 hypothetical protein G4Z16_19175 [Streptomyces bathyalis]
MARRVVREVCGRELRPLWQHVAALLLRSVPIDGGKQRQGSLRGGVRRVRNRFLEVLRGVLVMRTGGLATGTHVMEARLVLHGRGAAEQGEQHGEEDTRQTRPQSAPARRAGRRIGR